MRTLTKLLQGPLLPILARGVVFLVAFGAPAANATELSPYVAEYKVDISVLGGVLETELRRTDDGFRATHVVRATGLSKLLAGGAINDTAEFEITDGGLLPTRFASDDTVTRDKTQADIRFDWADGEATGMVNGDAFSAPLTRPMYDRVSIQYKLMFDLMNGGTGKDYVLFEVDELKDLDVRILGEREVRVPYGKFTAVGVQHQATDSKRVTTLWCVEELGYLPVMIEQHRKGKLRMRATLRRYEPLEI